VKRLSIGGLMVVEVRQPYTSLYYPYATFGDERWLKGALLSWDRVCLIRPLVSTPYSVS
jgi:hypothetical protein